MPETNEETQETEKIKKTEEVATTEGSAALKEFFTPVAPAGALSTDASGTKAPAVTGDEAALMEMVEEMDAVPALTYEERLKAQGISMEEALVIVDALMSKGVYRRKYTVTKKHMVEFKTRSMEDQGQYVKDLEGERPMYAATSNALISRHNLSASLVAFKDTEFKDYEHALAFVVKLPEPVFRILIEKLRKFDILIMTVMDEGALENF